jgi:hypothetical protein
MYDSFSPIRRTAVVVAACAILSAAAALPGAAQMRQKMADNLATDAANKFVTKINSESCPDFAATMAQRKNATPSPIAAKLQANTAARTTYVNIVAAPLLNKMIDCNLLPGGS